MYRAFSKPLRIFLLICAAPIALAVLFVGCRVAGVLTTRPFPWSVTRSKPRPDQLVGTYKISTDSENFADSILWGSSRLASIELRADHSATVAYFPNTDGFGEPSFTSSSGTGTWRLEEPGLDGIVINIDGQAVSKSDAAPSQPHFDQLGYGGVLLGHSWPYELYFGVGDPDDGKGIVFQRER